MDKERTKPTATQIKVLMTDWMSGKRDAATFVHKDTRGAISNDTRGDNYSDYFARGIANLSQEETLKAARELAQNTVNSMTDHSVRVVLGQGGSFTDGTQICVASDMFDDKKLDVGKKTDLLVGFAIHEASHINHTDSEAMTSFIRKEPGLERLRHTLFNIIEDERIEYLVGEPQEKGGDGMPGYSDFLAVVKNHLWNKFEKDDSQPPVTEKVPRYLDALLRAIRYPMALKKEEAEEFFDELDAARKTLIPFPKSQEGVNRAVDGIVNIMRDMIEDEQKQEQKQSGDKNKQQDQQQGQGQQQGALQTLEQAMASTQAAGVLDKMDKNIAAPNNGNAGCLRDNHKKEFVNGDAQMERTGGNGAGSGNIVYVRTIKGDKYSYNASYAAIKKWIPTMSKALRCKTEEKDYELLGMDSGKLNTNKLVSLKTGNVNIFKRKGSVTTDSACVCILIDESGSMRGMRERGARNAAILINEAVKHIPNIELFAYGFTTSELNVYCEGRNADRYALGNTKADGGTPTAQAMEIAAKRVRRLTSSTCLMLVITDGEPDNILSTMEQDRLLSKKGFVPVGIDIAGNNMINKVFHEAISISDMSRLAPIIGKIVKKKLRNTLKRHDC